MRHFIYSLINPPHTFNEIDTKDDIGRVAIVTTSGTTAVIGLSSIIVDQIPQHIDVQAQGIIVKSLFSHSMYQ